MFSKILSLLNNFFNLGGWLHGLWKKEDEFRKDKKIADHEAKDRVEKAKKMYRERIKDVTTGKELTIEEWIEKQKQLEQ